MKTISKKENIFWQWLVWHYFETPRGILRAWKNFLKFNLNYWSLPLLFKTFFSYWRKYYWSYGRGFDFNRYLTVFFSNLISRFLGAVMRSILIILGFLTEIFLIFLGIVVLFGWFVLPVLLVAGFLFGIKIIL
jgi:hypothetical protein